MDHPAAAQDQNAFVPKRGQATAQVEVEVVFEGFGGVDGQLHHRDIGFGEDMDQNRPVPWSIPQLSLSRPTQVGSSRSTTLLARAGSPGAG